MYYRLKHLGHTLMAAFILVPIAVACSSTKDEEPSTIPEGGAPPTGSNDAGPSGSDRYFCPSSAPMAGAPCPGDIVCEYGADPIFPCRTIAQCKAGTWMIRPPDTNGNCPSTTSCGSVKQPNNQPPCNEGAWCQASGGNCHCELNGLTTIIEWHCIEPDVGCTTVRPAAGTPCNFNSQIEDGAHCGLLDCTMVCIDKRWEPEVDCRALYGL